MRIKVLHLITKLEMGGAQGNTVYTFNKLSRDKFEPLLAYGPGGMLVVKKNGDEKIYEIKNLVREINPLKDLAAFFEIFSLLRKERPQIVHTHSSKAGIIGRFAALAAKIEVIVHTYHGFGFHERQNFFVRNFYIFIERVASLFCDCLIFVSISNMKKASAFKIGDPQKYRLIRSGVEISRLKKIPKSKEALRSLAIKNSSITVASLGNLKPQKNPDDFLLLAEKVIARNSDISFLYIGGGDRLEQIRSITKQKGMQDSCLFMGWVENPHTYLSGCEIFVLTSLWEGLPRSLVEAMTLGLIPVCYETDGVCDIIKDGVNGFLVKKGDINSAASRILELACNHSLFEKMKEAVHKTDLCEFDIDAMVSKQEDLYSQILRDRL